MTSVKLNVEFLICGKTLDIVGADKPLQANIIITEKPQINNINFENAKIKSKSPIVKNTEISLYKNIVFNNHLVDQFIKYFL